MVILELSCAGLRIRVTSTHFLRGPVLLLARQVPNPFNLLDARFDQGGALRKVAKGAFQVDTDEWGAPRPRRKQTWIRESDADEGAAHRIRLLEAHSDQYI